MNKTNLKSWLPFVIIVGFISLIVFFPSFKLHLSGDDYQSLWRYLLYKEGIIPGRWTDIKIFFTDYGPQDIFMQSVFQLFGLKPFFYYGFSYLSRLLAAFSFLPLIYFLTKSKAAAFFSSLLFSVATPGLETTDWVFNMPSYLAIFFFNLFLITFFKLKEKYNSSLLLLSILLFTITIVAMPIRMVFLPVLLVLSEGYWLIRNRKFSVIKDGFAKITVYIITFIIILAVTNIGGTIGLGYDSQRDVAGWKSNIEHYFSGIQEPFSEKKYQYFLYPVGQIGNIIIPNNLIRPRWEILTRSRSLFFVVIPSFVVVYFALKFLKRSYPQITERSRRVSLIILSCWAVFVWFFFAAPSKYQLATSVFMAMLFGGYVLTMLALLFIKNFKSKTNSYLILFAVLTIILSFAQYWVRNPNMVLVTYNRYFIIPAAGLAFLVGIIIGFAKNKSPIVVGSFCLVGLHMLSSFYYLNHLSKVREVKNTDNIRSAIPNIFTQEKLKNSILFYFEPQGSEVLHHSLLFGFPVIMSIQYDFLSNVNLIYTDDWSEVVSAHQTGEGTRRFNPLKIEPVKLDNIYSYELFGFDLSETTEETRSKLKDMDNDNR